MYIIFRLIIFHMQWIWDSCKHILHSLKLKTSGNRSGGRSHAWHAIIRAYNSEHRIIRKDEVLEVASNQCSASHWKLWASSQRFDMALLAWMPLEIFTAQFWARQPNCSWFAVQQHQRSLERDQSMKYTIKSFVSLTKFEWSKLNFCFLCLHSPLFFLPSLNSFSMS